ncbi:MAG: 2-dehydropantoate 2-reductase [Gaiellales bacterium]|jgi:2-dehydropantoate 2-reductase|nr:2-dehydropantoate 2-reductase [Gaiellales bacterium]
MKVAILGAGAIGAYVGASLARGGTDVSLIARGAQLAALRRDGVIVHSPRGDFSAHPPATDDPAEIGPVDVVFLGLKAYSYAASGALLAPLLHDATAVVAAQNGVPWWYFHRHGGPYDGHRIEAVDPGGATTAAIAPERAIGCVVYCSTELEAPGVIRHGEGTRFSLGEPDRSISDRCAALSDALVAGGLKAPVEADIRDEIWIKLLGNAVFNPLSVLTRATLAAMCRHPGTRALAREGMSECLAIASALGARPRIDLEKRLQGAERVGEHRTSTLQDLEAGKRLELDALLVAVVELAELTGTPAPTLRGLAAESTLLAASLGLA